MTPDLPSRYLPHMTEDKPNLIASSKSRRVVLEDHPFSIEIYRLEDEDQWTLEVVDAEGTSHVWDELFDSDREARDTAIRALEQEGPQAFMRGDNVVPFRGR